MGPWHPHLCRLEGKFGKYKVSLALEERLQPIMFNDRDDNRAHNRDSLTATCSSELDKAQGKDPESAGIIFVTLEVGRSKNTVGVFRRYFVCEIHRSERQYFLASVDFQSVIEQEQGEHWVPQRRISSRSDLDLGVPEVLDAEPARHQIDGLRRIGLRTMVHAAAH